MGLLSIIRKQKLKEREIRVLMLGLDNSGKTTIVKSLKHEDVKQISPTMGFNIETLQMSGFNLNIWDIGGQVSLRSFWFNYFEKTDFLIWVIDSSSIQRLHESFQEFSKILQEDRLAGAGFLVLINKIDLYEGDRRLLEQKVIETLQLRDKLHVQDWQVMCCSAFTGEHLEEGINWLTDKYKERYYIIA